MKFNDLPTQFILPLILIGMVIGVGVLILTNMQKSTYVENSVTNESVLVVNHAGALAHSPIITVTKFADNTTVLTSNILSDPSITWDTDAGTFVTNGSWQANGTYHIDYSYRANSTATDALSSTVGAITPISSTWLPLIVTVIVLSIILGLVITSFVRGRK